MIQLVKFIAANNVIDIPDNEKYVNSIFNALNTSSYITTVSVATSAFGVSPSPVAKIDDTTYILDFNGSEKGTIYNWEIKFHFGTYKTNTQLEIAICSDSYKISVDNTYLEKLKVFIKNTIVRDWEKIIWSIDKDSEELSVNLYPHIYKTENLMRLLINEFMTKQFGPSWWDNYALSKLRQKASNRREGYKAKVPAFNNVDDNLMSIDIDDLVEIIRFKSYAWKPTYDETINRYINDLEKCSPEKLKIILEEQRELKIDFWNDLFSNVLPDGFCDKFAVFAKDRNHVMHNKLLDRTAYKDILSRGSEIEKDLENALSNIDKIIPSQELLELMEMEEAQQLEYEQAIQQSIKESEAGVNVLDCFEIDDLLEETLLSIVAGIEESLRFRNDIKINTDKNGDTFLSVKSLVNPDEEISFTYSKDIVEEEGQVSELNIYDDSINYITGVEYLNGKVYLDEDQGLYMPEVRDELDDYEPCVEAIVDYIYDHITNYKEDIDPDSLGENIFCSSCGEETVCIDETELPLGTCVSCGHVNKIVECDKCGSLFNAEDDGNIITDDEGEVTAICESCEEEYFDDDCYEADI